MTIKDCPCRLKLIRPLNSPTNVPNAKITMNASHGGTPKEINDIRPRFVAPIKNGIDKSRPPNITTSVWPIVAIPKNEAKTNIDFIFCRDRKPSMETDPIIKRPTKTATPIMTLLLIFKNLYAMKANIKKPNKIIAETTVLPEKKPGTRKHKRINKPNNNKNPVTAIQFLAIKSQNTLLLLVISVSSILETFVSFSSEV